MKKLLAFTVCAFLLVFAAYAAEEVKLSCEDVEVLAGGEAEVSVVITDNPGFSAVWLTPVYDKDIFEIDAENAALFGFFEEGANYIWAKEEGVNVTSLGALCTLKIKADSAAPSGDYTIRLTPYECYNSDEKGVNISEASFKVTVKAPPVATSVAISGGQEIMEVPALEDSPFAGTPFTATVFDQYGNQMNADVTWTIEPEYFGVIVSGGVVSVYNKASAGAFTVKASAGAVFDTATVTLNDNTLDLPVLDTEPQIYVESVTEDAGKSVTVNVYVKNNPGFAALTLTPFFPEELTLTNAKNGTLFGNFQKGVNYVWLSGGENVTSDGKLMSLTFNIPGETPSGEYKIRFKVRVCASSDEQEVGIKVSPGTVTVKSSFLYGDVNTDGKIDIIDLIRLTKYLAGSITLTDTQLKAANVNKDNKVDIIDVIRLSKYLAGAIISFD